MKAVDTFRKHAQVNGQNIHYVERGSGPTVVLAHGWGFDHTVFEPLMRCLEGSFRLVAYDLRGHGRSEPASGRYSLRDLASDLSGLVEHLALPEAPVVVGHSLGAAVVQQFAVDHPDAARAIIILDGDLNPPANRALMEVGTLVSAWSMRLLALLVGDDAVLRVVPGMLDPAAYSAQWRREHRDELKQGARAFRERNHVSDLVWSLRAWGTRPNLTRAIGSVTKPTLLMRGAKDPIVTRSKLARLARALPDARLETLEDAGHTIVLERPDVVAELIQKFLVERADLGPSPVRVAV